MEEGKDEFRSKIITQHKYNERLENLYIWNNESSLQTSNMTDLHLLHHLEDHEPWERTRGLKLLCRFNLLKAEGVLIWNSAELLSPCSTGDSVTRRGLEPSLLHGKMKKDRDVRAISVAVQYFVALLLISMVMMYDNLLK